MLMDFFPPFLNQIHIFLKLCLHKVTFLLLCDLKSKPHIICVYLLTPLNELNELSAFVLVMLSDVPLTISCFDIEESVKIIFMQGLELKRFFYGYLFALFDSCKRAD